MVQRKTLQNQSGVLLQRPKDKFTRERQSGLCGPLEERVFPYKEKEKKVIEGSGGEVRA